MMYQRQLTLLVILGGFAFCAAGRAHDVEHLTGGRFIRRGIIDDFATGKYTPPREMAKEFWYDLAHEEINKRLKLPQTDRRRAKNLILFLGDGMSLSTVTAARILKGQRQGQTGEESSLSFETFNYTGLSRTYCSNAQVPDSACTATAYLCGVKTNIVELGVTAAVSFNDCTQSQNEENRLTSIAEWAQNAGKATGIVTTTTLTHASPSGAYAKSANRLWECDTDIEGYGIDSSNCVDIAAQLIRQTPGKNFDVMFGGGMGKFLPKSAKDAHGAAGERSDGLDLITEWKSNNPTGALVTNRKQLLEYDPSTSNKIMGVFQSGLMKFHLDANATYQPTLEELTKTTIQKLSRNPNGYFAFIEGGLIDYGNHYTKAAYALDETLEFEKAIKMAQELTNSEDTLIVVTSDHGHALTIPGYSGRGTPILGLNQHNKDNNDVKYSVLNYAAGPKQYLDEQGNRIDLSDKIGPNSFEFPSSIPMDLGVHSGEDVAIFASGPQSHLFTGVMEQHTIPHLMAYAACIGTGPKLCDP